VAGAGAGGIGIPVKACAVESEEAERALIALAVESWRFSRLFARVVTKLDAGEVGRYANQHRYFLKKIEECLDVIGLNLVTLEGQLFDPGMAVSALNLGDFGPDESLLVDQMIEPIIMSREGLRRQGTVMLRKLQA
jgi:hypothetical protein